MFHEYAIEQPLVLHVQIFEKDIPVHIFLERAQLRPRAFHLNLDGFVLARKQTAQAQTLTLRKCESRAFIQ